MEGWGPTLGWSSCCLVSLKSTKRKTTGWLEQNFLLFMITILLTVWKCLSGGFNSSTQQKASLQLSYWTWQECSTKSYKQVQTHLPIAHWSWLNFHWTGSNNIELDRPSNFFFWSLLTCSTNRFFNPWHIVSFITTSLLSTLVNPFLCLH